ncbi:uncharacterized protein ISCGN_005584 [Ixodes scapularis]
METSGGDVNMHCFPKCVQGYPVEWPHWQKLHAILGKRPVPHSWNNYYDDERTSESRIVRSENGSMHYDEPEIEFPEFRAGDLQFQNLQPIRYHLVRATEREMPAYYVDRLSRDDPHALRSTP